MVMTRLAIKDRTFIRNNPEKVVQAVIGLDFNALYLWAQSMPTPTGHFDYWVSNEHKGFQKVVSSKSISIEWLEQEALKCACFIQHLGAVRSELKEEFMQDVYPKWFVTNKGDKRTPGLLKVEWKRTSMCCLAAKTYIGIGDQEDGQKISSK
uniref:Uncharacterized protein n=1 Tax=Romanomermis culicivorax TaxID=13658 RepID=A0A915I987_ROMCU